MPLDKETKLGVLRRAEEILAKPYGFTRGRWIRNRRGFGERLRDHGVHGDGPPAAYEAGLKSLADTPNDQAICCCVEGACYVAAGEQGVDFAEANEVIEDLGETIHPGFGTPGRAMHTNDTKGKKVTLKMVRDTIERIEAELDREEAAS